MLSSGEVGESLAEEWLAWHTPTFSPAAAETVQLELREDNLCGDADYVRAANAITSIVNLMVGGISSSQGGRRCPGGNRRIRSVEVGELRKRGDKYI